MIRVVNVRGINKAEDRARICYVGREFAGWTGHGLVNPFRPRVQNFDGDTKEECNGEWRRAVQSCLEQYRSWLMKSSILEVTLMFLFAECDGGAKPLGCWCVNATAGDGSPCVCHAQVLAELLRERIADGRLTPPPLPRPTEAEER